MAVKYPDNLTVSEQAQNVLKFLAEATPEEVKEGLTWYAEVRAEARKWAKKYGYTLEQVAAVIAIMSPRTSWDKNMLFAHSVLQGVADGLKPSEIKSAGARTMSGSVAAAHALLYFDDLALLAGNKVVSFYHNIAFIESKEITHDIWSNRVLNNNLEDNRSITDLRYNMAQEAYHEALEIAKEHKLVKGLKYGYQIQAIVWIVARRLWKEKRYTL